MDKPSRGRLRVLALFLPLTAVLYIGAEALDPKGTDRLVNTTAAAFSVLPVAARHSAQLYVSGSLTIAALGALAVSYAAIALLVRGRGWVLATVAALLGAVGAFCGAIVNVLVGVNLAAPAAASLTGPEGRNGGKIRLCCSSSRIPMAPPKLPIMGPWDGRLTGNCRLTRITTRSGGERPRSRGLWGARSAGWSTRSWP